LRTPPLPDSDSDTGGGGDGSGSGGDGDGGDGGPDEPSDPACADYQANVFVAAEFGGILDNNCANIKRTHAKALVPEYSNNEQQGQ